MCDDANLINRFNFRQQGDGEFNYNFNIDGAVHRPCLWKCSIISFGEKITYKYETNITKKPFNYHHIYRLLRAWKF